MLNVLGGSLEVMQYTGHSNAKYPLPYQRSLQQAGFNR
jgi:hypothetical protein